VLSVITYGELLYGYAKSAQRTAALERLRDLVHLLPALALPASAAETYGAIRADQKNKAKGSATTTSGSQPTPSHRDSRWYQQRKRILPGARPEGTEPDDLETKTRARSPTVHAAPRRTDQSPSLRSR
jgi:hypothetical protein